MAHALHQLGQESEATLLFRESETMQENMDPNQPILYSLRGYLYCDLLLALGQIEEVKERVQKLLQWSEQRGSLLETALGNLVLSRAYLLEAQQAGDKHFGRAIDLVNLGVSRLRQAGTIHRLPQGLLARAELFRLAGDFGKAENDLIEVHRIASRSGMDLYIGDYHLELAKLQLAENNPDKAREQLLTAKEMINRMSYHRRDKEVAELEAQLG